MEKLFNIINVGYMTNTVEVKVVFNKKYLFVLEKLLKLNCIHSYFFDKKTIFIKLRYFRNKPLFFFLLKSKSGNKIYKKFLNNTKVVQTNISLFFTNKGVLTLQESIIAKVGGEHIVDITFLNNK